MAKYVPIEMVKSYSGKICEHSDVYFAKKGNTLYTGKICNPRMLPRSRTRASTARCADTCSHRSMQSLALNAPLCDPVYKSN